MFFFQDGHVQKVRYHPMPSLSDYVCIGASVLPSMKKHTKYDVRIVLSTHTAHVRSAICVCPAGLSGCCNHITATLYCFEEYFRLKLNEEDQKGCTEKLQVWNQPKPARIDARPTNLIMLMKKVYGVEKQTKIYRVNQWDCRPTSRRKLHPERRDNFRNRLLKLEQAKAEAAAKAVDSAVSANEKRKAVQTQSMIQKYGTSCFLQLFDDEPMTASTVDRLQQNREDRIARAAAKKSQFKLELSQLVTAMHHDHTYCCSDIPAANTNIDGVSQPPAQHLIRSLYEEHVCVSPSEAADVELMTRGQSQCKLWHNERKLRITSSILKTVCHRKPDTAVNPFVVNKLAPKLINSLAIKHGQQNEDIAIRSYVQYQKSKGYALSVHKCGLYVDPATPWLAASPDAIVKFDQNKECFFEQDEEGQIEGCLEVKCPYLCLKKSIAEASLESPSFCLRSSGGKLCLRESHPYFYQVQAQLYVTRLPWCDFVVWSPDEIHVERIYYNQHFIMQAIAKARNFYFDVFLPSIVPCMLIHTRSCSNSYSNYENVKVLEEKDPFVCTETPLAIKDHDSNDCKIVCVPEASKPSPPPNVLQKLCLRRHTVNGDGNCLYHAIAHQAGFIDRDCHGDTVIANQLRVMALNCMHQYPAVRQEDGIGVIQWERKKMKILQPNEWGGDLEVRLLAIAIGLHVIVITGSCDFKYARKFPCNPPPLPKMRGGIFIPVTITELLDQWEQYKPSPLLILYNGTNHYDSTISL